MTQSFYDLSVASYLQILGGEQTTLARAMEFAGNNPLNLDDQMHFHTTTSYATLRLHRAPLGQRDFLGRLRVGAE